MRPYQATVIISTYNQPKWLEKVLWSYEYQTFKDFEIIIADDGSEKATRDLIESFKETSKLAINHIWQEDKGFRKTKILNQAIIASNSEYIIFTDGDCIGRNDFVQTHLQLKQENTALSGGYYKLNLNVSTKINKTDIETQNCFKFKWLEAQGQQKDFKSNKLSTSKFKTKFLDAITPTKATFDGMNVSCYKHDLLAVNGFDERMSYGGEDREIGERMMNNGVKFKQVRYSAICLHLYHERPYAQAENSLNSEIRKITKNKKIVKTEFGIDSK
ncbi:Glycosyltransferase involved in cell wall bisynthesis [Flavobacteriaceae bacterium MAR_2010_188]|nr:Glycosyltransferase involved in cell wall bisynthesis [Flavobacteriaceae bacterium MAR_2010_188]